MAKSAFLDDPSAILDSIVDCVIVIDHDFVIKGVNKAAEIFFGIPATALLGQSALELVVDGDRVETTVRFKELLDGDEIPPAVFRIISATGKSRWVEATGRRLGAPIENIASVSSVLSGDAASVVVALRSVGSRLKRELEGLQAVRRAHLISQLAAQLQTAGPATFAGVLLKAFEEVGALLGANFISTYEVEASGRSFVLRSRWEEQMAALRSRVVPQARVAVEQVPNVVKALTGPESLAPFDAQSRLGAELQTLDAAVCCGVLVPLSVSDEHVGVLVVSWSEEHHVLNEEAQFLAGLAEVVAVALNRIVTNQALITQNSLLERIFERTKVPMLMVSRTDLRVTRANTAAAELYGITSKRLDGLSIAQVSPELAQELIELDNLAEYQEYRDLRITMHGDHNGERSELELSIDTMTMMELPCYLIVVRNISGAN